MMRENELRDLTKAAIDDFIRVAQIADAEIHLSSIEVEILSAPHRPSKLPLGKMAVYSFFLNGHCLKVGKVGENSAARYSSQHYHPKSAPSTLARSILSSQILVGRHSLDETNIKAWMWASTDRVNILLPAKLGTRILTLLEGFLQCRWRPQFEGKSA